MHLNLTKVLKLFADTYKIVDVLILPCRGYLNRAGDLIYGQIYTRRIAHVHERWRQPV